MLFRAVQKTKRYARIGFGFVLLVLGIVAIPTPVPGYLLFALGLATLAAEFEWARKLLERVTDVGLRVRAAVRAALPARRVVPDS